ncbi:MAG: contact-dependent growth inhibition system immunity protein [Flavobacterium sp.]
MIKYILYYNTCSVELTEQSYRVRPVSRYQGYCESNKMNDIAKPEKRSWVYVKSNDDFIFIETYSGYWNCLPDPSGESFMLSHSSSNEEVGEAVLRGVSASRIINPKHDPEFFDVMGRVVPQYNSWISEVMSQFGYKTKRAMFKDMKNCAIELVKNTVMIQPSHHEKLEAWSGKGITESDYVVIPSNSSPVEVGAALRLAISRCT